eukprot:353948-Chlamydomonas_euryale.AAC.2
MRSRGHQTVGAGIRSGVSTCGQLRRDLRADLTQHFRAPRRLDRNRAGQEVGAEEPRSLVLNISADPTSASAAAARARAVA